jgi:hypothetical protein
MKMLHALSATAAARSSSSSSSSSSSGGWQQQAAEGVNYMVYLVKVGYPVCVCNRGQHGKKQLALITVLMLCIALLCPTWACSFIYVLWACSFVYVLW